MTARFSSARMETAPSGASPIAAVRSERTHGRFVSHEKRTIRVTADETESEELRAAPPVQTAVALRLGRAVVLAIAALICVTATVDAAPLRIVAIGASNTHGWYVGNQGAYPTKLQALLRAKGIDAQVTNAGVPFETTGLMLRRMDRDAPNGTGIVILGPGANGRRFFGPLQQPAAIIAEVARGLEARSINVIVYGEVIPLR